VASLQMVEVGSKINDVVCIDYKFSYEICSCIGDRISGGRFIKLGNLLHINW